MKLSRKVITFIVLIILLSACTSTTIEISSNKDQQQIKLLEKLYILVDIGEIYIPLKSQGELFGDCLINSFKNKSDQFGVEIKVEKPSGMELSDDEIAKKVEDFGGKELMLIQLKDAAVYPGNIFISGTLDISIFNLINEKRIWRAKVQVEIPYISSVSTKMVDAIIAKIISKMREDGLLK